jgi:hypothetical protein
MDRITGDRHENDTKIGRRSVTAKSLEEPPRPRLTSTISRRIPCNGGAKCSAEFWDNTGPSFLLSKDFTVKNIDCLGSTTTASGFGKGINRHGAIAGFCGQGGRIHGFLRRKNGDLTLLDFPGANLTEAAGINDFDQIVGDYRDSGGRFHGFFWDNGLFLTFDVPFPGTRSSALVRINNVGQIIGSYFDGNVSAQFPNGHPHAFLYDDEGFTSIDFPGALSTGVSAMNDSGTIVGFYASNDPIGHPYVLEHGSFTTSVLPFPNVTLTDLTGINNRGQLVGRYIERAPSFPNQIFNRGFVATPQRQENARQEENIVSSLGSQ